MIPLPLCEASRRAFIIPILQKRKSNPRGLKGCAQDHTEPGVTINARAGTAVARLALSLFPGSSTGNPSPHEQPTAWTREQSRRRVHEGAENIQAAMKTERKERSGSGLISHPLLSYEKGSILQILFCTSFAGQNILGVPASRLPNSAVIADVSLCPTQRIELLLQGTQVTSSILQLQTMCICIFVLMKLYLKGRVPEVRLLDQRREYIMRCCEILAD